MNLIDLETADTALFITVVCVQPERLACVTTILGDSFRRIGREGQQVDIPNFRDEM
jgi:hypothetical protein